MPRAARALRRLGKRTEKAALLELQQLKIVDGKRLINRVPLARRFERLLTVMRQGDFDREYDRSLIAVLAWADVLEPRLKGRSTHWFADVMYAIVGEEDEQPDRVIAALGLACDGKVLEFLGRGGRGPRGPAARARLTRTSRPRQTEGVMLRRRGDLTRRRGGRRGPERPRRRPRARGARLHGAVLEARDRIGGRVWVQRDALAGLDLDMGGAWVADCQPSVWAEADRYGVAREHDPLPARMRWVLGGERIDRACRSTSATSASSSAPSARCSPRRAATTPRSRPTRRGSRTSTSPPRPGSTRRASAARVRELPTSGSPRAAPRPVADVSMLEFLRWISAADWSVWRHLEAAVLGWRFRDGTAALYEAIAGDVAGEIRLGDAGGGDRAGRRAA